MARPRPIEWATKTSFRGQRHVVGIERVVVPSMLVEDVQGSQELACDAVNGWALSD